MGFMLPPCLVYALCSRTASVQVSMLLHPSPNRHLQQGCVWCVGSCVGLSQGMKKTFFFPKFLLCLIPV